MTSPSVVDPSAHRTALANLAICKTMVEIRDSEAMLMIWDPWTLATSKSWGTASIRAAMPTTPAVYEVVSSSLEEDPAMVPPVAKMATLGSDAL